MFGGRGSLIKENLKKQLRFFKIEVVENKIVVKNAPKGKEENNFYKEFLDLAEDKWFDTYLLEWGKKELLIRNMEDFINFANNKIKENPKLLDKIESEM